METTMNANSSKEDRIQTYILERIDDGQTYFKSKFIAREIGLTPKEVGAVLSKFEDGGSQLEVERWAYSTATTWRINKSTI
ncbi:DUF7123 family protein [Haloferax volcanii]|uniref:DUF7123 family protein n=1 Tax=Haloferax volcanii TaxID=2246 RepID=UPI0023DAB3EB|nr:hypothetical protein [Haloferax lucentense]WEL27455.1 Uncharacterized protein SVXHx_3247 [Haloferax lucentense]